MKRFIIALALLVSSQARAQTAIGKYGALVPASSNSCPTGKVCLWYDSIASKLKLRVSGSDFVSAGTLQDAYTNGGAGPQVIDLTTVGLGVRIRGDITGTLFMVSNLDESTPYLRINTSGGLFIRSPAPTGSPGNTYDTINDYTGLATVPHLWATASRTLAKLKPVTSTNTSFLISGTDSVITEVAGGPIAAVSAKSLVTAAPTTLASGATITPTQRVHYVSGTSTISTIAVASLPSSFSGEIILVPTGAWATNTAGNIANVITAVANVPVIAVYDSGAAKWFVK